MKIDVSIGEVVDKITILQIKKQKISDKFKLKHIEKELDILEGTVRTSDIKVPSRFIDELREINTLLWEAEDTIRESEENNLFDKSFIECARLDAILNDKRFLIKNKINNHCKSNIKEQKSYEKLYTTD